MQTHVGAHLRAMNDFGAAAATQHLKLNAGILMKGIVCMRGIALLLSARRALSRWV